MFQNSKDQKLSEKQIEKNLKMMVLSAIVLVVLFGYTLIKSDTPIQGTSYYVGVAFLFILLILSFALQKYRKKVRSMIPANKFQQELDEASEYESQTQEKQKDSLVLENTSIEAITSNISFKDIAGIQEIKEELEEIVSFLNSPKKYQKYNVKLPRGVLLVGPPGVGKTLIAKAVAGEADVPFFYQSGASFVHIYVGMGAKKVRELFTAAKKSAPSIIFIDEIDAIGKERGVSGNDEREATLNELLTQMDGFDSSSGVMVIAATNKIDVLDDALLRAGRFDRRVFLSLPNTQDREKILELYLKSTPYEFDLKKLATQTSGFNSAALATLINEALLFMIKEDESILLEKHISVAKEKLEFGKKQIKILSDEQKEILAIYQSAVAFIKQKTTKLFDEQSVMVFDQFCSKSDLEQKIQELLAGFVALEIIKKQPYAINEQDMKQAYKIAKEMVEIYKMESDVELIIEVQKTRLKEKFQNSLADLQYLIEKMKKDDIVVF